MTKQYIIIGAVLVVLALVGIHVATTRGSVAQSATIPVSDSQTAATAPVSGVPDATASTPVSTQLQTATANIPPPPPAGGNDTAKQAPQSASSPDNLPGAHAQKSPSGDPMPPAPLSNDGYHPERYTNGQ